MTPAEKRRGDVIALAAGALFGVGLVVSGMSRPSKVLGFLDVAGAWDPSLAFVMVGAIGVYALLSRLVLRRKSPLFDDRFHVPPRKRAVDGRLLTGAAVFGAGWGLAGYCPGPAIVGTGTGGLAAVVFVAAMTCGMLVFRLAERARPAATPAAEQRTT